jgi:hypothetical protein
MSRFFLMAGLFVSLSLAASGSGLNPSTPLLFTAADKLWGDGDWFARVDLGSVLEDSQKPSCDFERDSLKLQAIEDTQQAIQDAQKVWISRVDFMDQATRCAFVNTERSLADLFGSQQFCHRRASGLEARMRGLESRMLKNERAQGEHEQAMKAMRQELQQSRLESRQNEARLAAVEGTLAALNRLIVSEIGRLEEKITALQKSGMRAHINLHPRSRATRTSTERPLSKTKKK